MKAAVESTKSPGHLINTQLSVGRIETRHGLSQPIYLFKSWMFCLSRGISFSVGVVLFTSQFLSAATFRAPAQSQPRYVIEPAALPSIRYKSGQDTLRAFGPVAYRTRNSIVKFDVNGSTAALGAVIDTNGLAITKASEIADGKLTCWIPGGKEVSAKLLATDTEHDVALIKVDTKGLKPVQWADEEAVVGQWAVTPGIEESAQAVGVVSVKARPPRAFVGISFEQFGSFRSTKIAKVHPGMSAAKAGLKAGDAIIAVNDQKMENRAAVVDSLMDFREGETVTLRIKRDEDEFDVQLKMMPPSAEMKELTRDAPSGIRLDRTARLGTDISARAAGFEQVIQHDTVLEPWLCGGPLVNLDGKAIGLNIARAERVASYALPAKVVKQVIEKLKSDLTTEHPR